MTPEGLSRPDSAPAGGGQLPAGSDGRSRVPAVWAGLAVAVALDVPVQLVWKALMAKYANPAGGPHAADLWTHARWFLGQTRLYELLALFLAQFFNWIWVLGNADLSFAQPFTALSYVAVSGGAVLFMGEHLTPLRVLGIGVILAGVLLVGSTQAKTASVPA